MFPYENMQNSNSDYNWKIKEMEGGHRVWLVLQVQAILMRDEERAMWRFFFTGWACLFNGELGLRSLNRGLPLHCKAVMHTLSVCVAGAVLYLNLRPVWLPAWCTGWLFARRMTDYLMSRVADWKIKRRDLTPSKNKMSLRGLKIASWRPSSEWVTQDNNASAMTIRQQYCCLGLITVKVNCPSAPVVVLVHVAASKQLFWPCTYLLYERKLGLALVIFLLRWPTAAEEMHRKCWRTRQWLLYTGCGGLTGSLTDWRSVWLIRVADSPLLPFLSACEVYDGERVRITSQRLTWDTVCDTYTRGLWQSHECSWRGFIWQHVWNTHCVKSEVCKTRPKLWSHTTKIK